MKISLLIVTHNRLSALCELLESITRQTVQPFEIVVVNDAGERVEIIQELYPELPIRLIHLDENVQHVNARNVGVRELTGDVIMLSDDDDYFTPCHIERMSKALEDADFVFSDAEIVSFEEKARPASRCQDVCLRIQLLLRICVSFLHMFLPAVCINAVYTMRLAILIQRCIIIGTGTSFCVYHSMPGSNECQLPA